jgi:signal transduction histidine kinase
MRKRYRLIPVPSTIFFLLLLGCGMGSLHAQDSGGSTLDTNAIPMLYDEGGNLSLAEIIQMDINDYPLRADALAGYRRGNVWLRIESGMLDPGGGYLFEEYGVDEIELFIPWADGGYDSRVSGWARPTSSRALPIRHTNFAIPAESIASGRPVFLRMASNSSMQTSLIFRTALELEAFHRNDTWLLGLFYGVCLGFLFYNVFFAIVLRNRAQVIFLAYLVTSILVFAYNNGIGSVLLWPRTPVINHQSLILITPVTLIFLILFCRELLREEITLPSIDRGLRYFALVVLLLIVVLQFLDRYIAYQIASYFFLVVPIIMIGLGILMLIYNHSLKWYFLASFILYMSGITLIILRNLGIADQSPLTNFSFQLGYLTHLLLLGLSLSQRINSLRTAAEEAQGQLSIINRDLETTVDDRTRELKSANSDLRRKISELRLAQKNLAESEKHAALGRLVAGLAHEINTPLGNSITAISYLRSMLEGWENSSDSANQHLPELREIGEIVSRNLETTSKLVDGFKELATDQYDEEPRAFRLAEYIEELLLSFEHRFRQIGLEFRNNVDPELELYCVPGHIARIFTNLINNSLDHGFSESGDSDAGAGVSEKRGPRLEINSLSSLSGIQLRFIDNGAGIDHSLLPKIFDPFFTTKRSRGYKGLGLSISYNLVTNSLGGNIEYRIPEDGGLEFLLTLPGSIRRSAD